MTILTLLELPSIPLHQICNPTLHQGVSTVATSSSLPDWLAFVGGLLMSVEILRWISSFVYLIAYPLFWVWDKVKPRNMLLRILLLLIVYILMIPFVLIVLPVVLLELFRGFINARYNALLLRASQLKAQELTDILNRFLKKRGQPEVPPSTTMEAIGLAQVPFVGMVGVIFVTVGLGLKAWGV